VQVVKITVPQSGEGESVSDLSAAKVREALAAAEAGATEPWTERGAVELLPEELPPAGAVVAERRWDAGGEHSRGP
jgi:hypothetical protein